MTYGTAVYLQIHLRQWNVTGTRILIVRAFYRALGIHIIRSRVTHDKHLINIQSRFHSYTPFGPSYVFRVCVINISLFCFLSFSLSLRTIFSNLYIMKSSQCTDMCTQCSNYAIDRLSDDSIFGRLSNDAWQKTRITLRYRIKYSDKKDEQNFRISSESWQ